MNNKLLDNYTASGTDAKSFLAEMRDLSARTSYPFVDPIDTYFLSYHKTEDRMVKGSKDVKRIYYFYKLDRAGLLRLARYNDGLTDVPFVVTLKNGVPSESCAFFDEVIKNTGLMVAYTDNNGNTHYNGVSKYGVITLCKRADAKGERLHEKGLFRDMYIADGILPRHFDEELTEASMRNDRLISDGFKMVIRNNIKETRDGTFVKTGFGLMVGVFSGTYNESGMMILADLYKFIHNDRTIGPSKITKWSSDQGYTTVTIEFPDAAKEFQEKYNLPVKLIPGIKLISSDCGLSSVVVNGTYRVDKTECTMVIGSVTRKHSGEILASELFKEAKSKILEKFEEFAQDVSSLRGKPLGDFDLETEQGKEQNRSAINGAISVGFNKLSLSKILGQKRAAVVKEDMIKDTDEGALYTYYDVAERFFRIGEYIEETGEGAVLGKTASDCLVKEIAGIVKANFAGAKKAQ